MEEKISFEENMKKLEEEYEQIKRKKQALSIFGPVSKKPYDLIINYSEDDTPNIELQSIVASSVIKGIFIFSTQIKENYIYLTFIV